MTRRRVMWHYVPPVKYTQEQLERFVLADLLNDARVSLRYARELERGANPRSYGMTALEFRAHAEQMRAEYRAKRGKVVV